MGIYYWIVRLQSVSVLVFGAGKDVRLSGLGAVRYQPERDGASARTMDEAVGCCMDRVEVSGTMRMDVKIGCPNK